MTNVKNCIWLRVKSKGPLQPEFLQCLKGSFVDVSGNKQNKWSCSKVRAIEVAYVEHFVWLQGEVQEGKHFKRQGKSIRKKIKGRSQSGREQKSILRRPVVEFLSVTCVQRPSANQVECIAVEEASFVEEDTNPIISNNQIQTLLMQHSSYQGIQWVLMDIKLI